MRAQHWLRDGLGSCVGRGGKKIGEWRYALWGGGGGEEVTVLDDLGPLDNKKHDEVGEVQKEEIY